MLDSCVPDHKWGRTKAIGYLYTCYANQSRINQRYDSSISTDSCYKYSSGDRVECVQTERQKERPNGHVARMPWRGTDRLHKRRHEQQHLVVVRAVVSPEVVQRLYRVFYTGYCMSIASHSRMRCLQLIPSIDTTLGTVIDSNIR